MADTRHSPCAQPKSGGACRTSHPPIRRNKKDEPLARLRQLGYQLLELRLRPGAGGAGPHVALRAERERVFRHVVAVGSIDNDQQIVVAGGEIDLLDLDPQLLGELAGGLRPLGSVLDRTDALVGPAQRQDERRHAVLHGLETAFPAAAKRRANLRGCEFLGSAQKTALNSGMRCPPAARSPPIEIGTESSARSFQGRLMPSLHLKHDPEKWVPVFGKDHAQTRSWSGRTIQGKVIPL